jgi:sulfur-oxidizing protein SoxY
LHIKHYKYPIWLYNHNIIIHIQPHGIYRGEKMIQQYLKSVSRRKAISIFGATAINMALPWQAHATVDAVAARINEITGGADVIDDLISLDMPDIAENGNQVNLSFEVDSPMTADNYVKSVYVFADGNPDSDVAVFNFTPAMGACYATTRMRLSKTQNVHVLAAMSDGSFAKAETTVKVTIGGCGG